jgi:hypothetical protein
MNRRSRLLPIIAGAVAGGAIAFAVASGTSGTSRSVTTTVIQQGRGEAAVPTSLTGNKGLTVNQIYRQDGPGVVDIVVQTQQQGGFGLFGGGQCHLGDGELPGRPQGQRQGTRYRPLDRHGADQGRRALVRAPPDPVRQLERRPGR